MKQFDFLCGWSRVFVVVVCDGVRTLQTGRATFTKRHRASAINLIAISHK